MKNNLLIVHSLVTTQLNLILRFEDPYALNRPDTSRRQRRRLPPLPVAIALVPLKCSSRNLQFPHRVPFAKQKMPWCPFKNEAYRPDSIYLFTIKNCIQKSSVGISARSLIRMTLKGTQTLPSDFTKSHV